jgi:tRNA pseudouridine55 synthase
MIPSGFFNINKPAGQTSRQIVDAVSRIIGSKQVGHAGTLDPLATGVLVVAVKKATRLIEYVQRQAKEYLAEFRLGVTSTTDDCEGVLTEIPVDHPPSGSSVETTLQSFVGTIAQTPPVYSAVKVSGKRAYDLARRGAEFTLKPRPVEIHSIEVLEYSFPNLRLRIKCGSGTYIRSLARDLGLAVKTGGIMTSLVRTAIGSFVLDQAILLTDLGSQPKASDLLSHLLPLERAVGDLPRIELNRHQAKSFQQGRPFHVQPVWMNRAEIAVMCQGCFLGIGIFDDETNEIRPSKGGFASLDEIGNISEESG